MSAPQFTALDGSGNPVAGATITFSVSPAGIIAVPASVVTDGSGHATPTLVALSAGATTLSAYVGAVLLGTVMVVVPDAAAWTGGIQAQVNTFASGTRVGFQRIDGFDARLPLTLVRSGITPAVLAMRGDGVPAGSTITGALLSIETQAGVAVVAVAGTSIVGALDTGASVRFPIPATPTLAVPCRYAIRLTVTDGTTATTLPYEAGTICGRTTAAQGTP